VGVIKHGSDTLATFYYSGLETTRVTTTRTPIGEQDFQTVLQYDGFGRLVQVKDTDPTVAGTPRKTTYTYDPLDRLLQVDMRAELHRV
jgi:YD repeat-containing protein